MAVLAAVPVYSQDKSDLSHEDSLVLAEARGGLIPADTGQKTPRVPQVLPFPAVIDSVLKDFPNNLRNITGQLVLAQGEFENYASVVELPGAESCIITRWHSFDDTTASWQAQMFRSEHFSEASGRYHALFRQLQGCYLKLVDGSKFYLAGDWEPAKEEAPFTTSTLRLRTGDERYKEVKVEVELVFLVTDWAVHINIVSKKRDDEVGGTDEAER
ncbi:hypothetical protein GCM10011511_11120 [Puia dinghuensis]|uniref:Uncharacterized protein n=2 Tax=Puia dinghuensis TaxID=1792502 RepID=A0A8J2UA30_9BACT|nr:hypothetical protein GCM10011511_11120 [Puia dinghuensis]